LETWVDENNKPIKTAPKSDRSLARCFIFDEIAIGIQSELPTFDEPLLAIENWNFPAVVCLQPKASEEVRRVNQFSPVAYPH